MTLNVLGVNDVWAARTGKRKGVKSYSYPAFAFAGRPKCGRSEPWKRGRRPTDLGERNPGAAERRRSVNMPVMQRKNLFRIRPPWTAGGLLILAGKTILYQDIFWSFLSSSSFLLVFCNTSIKYYCFLLCFNFLFDC
jgi:hypothetical protein